MLFKKTNEVESFTTGEDQLIQNNGRPYSPCEYRFVFANTRVSVCYIQGKGPVFKGSRVVALHKLIT